MAKSLKHYNLVQGEGTATEKVIAVTTKTTTKRYFDNLIADYRRSNTLDSRPVNVVEIKPLFK